MNAEEMSKYYFNCDLRTLRRAPIEKCGIYATTYKMNCGACPLILVCIPGSEKLARAQRVRENRARVFQKERKKYEMENR